MDYEGVTLDWVYVYLAWELNITELKKLNYNSIEYASISEEDKVQFRQLFEEKWAIFVQMVIDKYWNKGEVNSQLSKQNFFQFI